MEVENGSIIGVRDEIKDGMGASGFEYAVEQTLAQHRAWMDDESNQGKEFQF